MKTSHEMLENLYRRRDAYLAEKRRRTRLAVRIAAVAAALCLAVTAAVLLTPETPPVAPATEPVTAETTAATTLGTTRSEETQKTTVSAETTAGPGVKTTRVVTKYAACLTADLTPQVIEAPEQDGDLAARIGDFAVRLALETGGGENCVFSPLSVYESLSTLESGASGKTLDELESLLGIKSAALDRESAALMKRLEQSRSLKMVNSLWISDKFSQYVRDDYLQRAVDCYRADVFSFTDDATHGYVKEANRWMSEQTDGRIDGTVEVPPEGTADAILMNVLNYAGTWEVKCTEEIEMPFYNNDGRTPTVKTLYYQSVDGGYRYPYAYGNTFTAFFLPYEDGNWFVGFAPTQEPVTERFYSPQEVLSELNDKGFAYYMGMRFTSEKIKIRIKLPMFSEKTEIELSDPMRDLGLLSMFSDNADFGRLFYRDRTTAMKIDQFNTSCRFEITKDGVSADAGTVVVGSRIRATTRWDPGLRVFYLDHPFVYAVIDGETDLPLFIGTKYNF